MKLPPLRNKNNFFTSEKAQNDALQFFENKAIHYSQLEEVASNMLKNKKIKYEDRYDDDKYTIQYINSILIVYKSGKLSFEQFVFGTLLQIESLHEAKWIRGDYNDRTDAIEQKILEVEKKYGLAENEYWPQGQEPEEYSKLTKQLDKIYDETLNELIVSIAPPDFTSFSQQHPDEIEELRERGRRSHFHKNEEILAIEDNIYRFEYEAITSRANKCWYSAIFSIAACSEGMLLLTCLQHEDDAKRIAREISKKCKSKQYKRPLTSWTFNFLIEVCGNAGWLKDTSSSNFDYNTKGLINLLKAARNLIHPGRHVIYKPWITLGERECEEAFSLYTLLLMAL